MMNQAVFSLRNLECRYPRAEHACLHIEELSLFQGETTFVLGASGCGKSTLLETIGLMNNTVVPNERLMFEYHSKGIKTDLSAFWNWNRNAQSEFRSRELGFIFQSTHLFDSLSIWDNVKLPALDSNQPNAEIDQRLHQLFDQILGGVDKHKAGTAISGGQRQRLAFIRAFCAPHHVLLADEPTGNLDPGNAHLLMKEVRQNAEHGRSAILVSHDVNLAIRFADRIILLTREDQLPGRPGVHKKELDFRRKERESWAAQGQTLRSSELHSLIEHHFLQEAQILTTS